MPPPDRPSTDRFDITVDGVRVPVRTGQTVAAVLLGAGRPVTRLTRMRGRPRGVFCGIGTCFDCLVVCNDEPGVRSCLRPVAPGDVIHTGGVIETGTAAPAMAAGSASATGSATATETGSGSATETESGSGTGTGTGTGAGDD